MKLLLSSIVLVTLTVFAQSELTLVKLAKGSKLKPLKKIKDEKANKSKKIIRDETKAIKAGVEESKTPKGNRVEKEESKGITPIIWRRV